MSTNKVVVVVVVVVVVGKSRFESLEKFVVGNPY